MFIGYADDHDCNVYRMWNPKTERVHINRDVIWMKQMMFTKGVEEPVIEVTNDNAEDGHDDEEKPADYGEVEDSRTDEEREDDSSEEELDDGNEAWKDVTTRSGRSVRAPSRLIAEVGQVRSDSQKLKKTIMRSWIRGMNLNLIQRSFYALEQHLEEDFKILKSFMSRSTKKP
jgi:hypothetical protein